MLVGKNVVQPELSNSASRIVKLFKHFGNRSGNFS